MKRSFKLEGLECANCAQKMEDAISKLDGVDSARINFMVSKLTIEADNSALDQVLDEAQSICSKYESECLIVR